MSLRFVNGYQTKNDLVFVFRTDSGELRKRIFPATSIGYFKTESLPGDILKSIVEDARVIQADPEGEWLRVSWHPGEWQANAPNGKGGFGKFVQFREQHCRQLETYGVQSFEADVSAIARFMADNAVEIARPKRCYIDLETDSRVNFQRARNGEARVLSWALVGEDGVQAVGCLPEDDDDAERELLASFWRALEPYDQVCAWNGDGFDFPVIQARSKLLECQPKETRRWLWMDQLLCHKRNNIMSAESGEEKQSFRLESVAQSLLGEGKHDFDGSKTWDAWVAGGDERAKLVAYNLQDTLLLPRIEAATGYLELFQTLCEACGVFPDSRGLKPTRQVDAFMLRLGLEKGVHFKTKWYGEETEKKFRGAFVMEPKCSGITKDVHCADFASLYPSIMLTWNLSPDTKIGFEESRGRGKFGYTGCFSPSTGLQTDPSRQGILCTALERLLGLRKEWTKKRASFAPGTPEAKDAERRTNAYKTAANSFYGVCGTPYSRFYDKDISEATTQNGVWLIKKTIEAAEERGMNVIYGDTDSLFVEGASKDEFEAFVKWCNDELYPSHLANFRCPTNRIQLAYEKEFERLVMTSAKRYVGVWKHYKGKPRVQGSKPEVKGLEYKRGDASRLARQFQGEVISLLDSGCEDVAKYYALVDSWKRRVLDGKLELGDVVLSKSISRDLDEYIARPKKDGSDGSVPAHVVLAREAKERGEEVDIGSRIYFVVTDASTSPMKVMVAGPDALEKCDRYYTWETTVFPPSERLLKAAFPRGDWTFYAKARPSRSYDPRQMSMFDPAGIQ